jgi:selenocysteine lyase/cysteine desulfurase
MVEYFNASRPEEIIFDNDMTTVTFTFSRANAFTLQSRDEIIVTRLDYDTNIAPWE